jgi:hypothetical protein
MILIGEGIPKIPDIGSAIKSSKGPSNQSPRKQHPDQEIPEGYWHIFNQMAQQN